MFYFEVEIEKGASGAVADQVTYLEWDKDIRDQKVN